MSKLSRKIKILKLRKKLHNKDIALATGANISTVFMWTSEEYCPKRIQHNYAVALFVLSDGYIKMMDCGYEA